MSIQREESGGTLTDLRPLYREKADGTLVEIGEVYREESDGTLTKVYSFDHPHDLTASDGSFCDTSGEFDEPVLQVNLNWTDEDDDDKTVAHVEIWRKDVSGGGSYTEIDTVSYNGDGNSNSYTDTTVSTGNWEYKVRNQYNDGTHSDYSDPASVTVSNPCI